MEKEEGLRQLFASGQLWQSGAAKLVSSVPSGFAQLDERLGGGWPTGVLTELLLATPGGGELQLLLPALSRLIAQPDSVRSTAGISTNRPSSRNPSAWVAWIAPPYIPYAPALMQQGLAPDAMLLVHAEKPADAMWAMEQSLRSKVCAAALCWLPVIANERQAVGNHADTHSLRRLQLAAEEGGCWAVIFRHLRCVSMASPAALRIAVQPTGSGLQLDILRNRYGPTGKLEVTC